MSYIDNYLPFCRKFEQPIAWMYLDTEGNVTAAVGEMLPDVNAACLLPFQIDGRTATMAEVSADFERVKRMPFGQNHAAGFYRCPTSPLLSEASISALLATTVRKVDAELTARLPCYAKLPDSWKMALLDMGFNLGVSGLLHEFTHFIAAVESGNWQAAEAQCRRPQLGMQRNDWTRAQFDQEVSGNQATSFISSSPN